MAYCGYVRLKIIRVQKKTRTTIGQSLMWLMDNQQLFTHINELIHQLLVINVNN